MLTPTDPATLVPLRGLPSLPPPTRPATVAPQADFASQLDQQMATTESARVIRADAPFRELEASLELSDRLRIDETAKQLEAVFLRQLLSQMKGSFGSLGGALGSSPTAEFYDDFAWTQFADGMAGGRIGGIGVGAMIYESLVRDEAGKLG